MSEVLLSIVIPVYNVKNYLKGCVDSILHSSLSDYEIILVDDGSTDGSGDLCDAFSNNYRHVRTVHKTNAGVSSARNIGLDLAKGIWIWFVDGDDYVEVSITDDKLRVLLEDHNFAIVNCRWNEYGNSVLYEANISCIPYNIWRCFFKKSEIMRHDVRFSLNRKYAEDQEFIMKYVLKCGLENWVALPQITYCYYVREGSAMTKNGVKWRQAKDISKVIVHTIILLFRTGNFCNKYALVRIKQMVKTLYVTIKK